MRSSAPPAVFLPKLAAEPVEQTTEIPPMALDEAYRVLRVTAGTPWDLRSLDSIVGYDQILAGRGDEAQIRDVVRGQPTPNVPSSSATVTAFASLPTDAYASVCVCLIGAFFSVEWA